MMCLNRKIQLLTELVRQREEETLYWEQALLCLFRTNRDADPGVITALRMKIAASEAREWDLRIRYYKELYV